MALPILNKIKRGLPDKIFLQLSYIRRMHKILHLKNPKTFNEKMQWLKLYNRKPEYSKLVDKYEVKKIVEEAIGSRYVIPTFGIWNHFDEIDFTQLPDQFVLKCTHDCGGMVICKEKKELNYQQAREKIEKSLQNNYYYNCREWPYNNVQPRILAEKYMKDDHADVLPVYKVFCFNGQARIIQCIQNDKTPLETVDYFDKDWNILDIQQGYPNSDCKLSKPQQLTKMLRIAEIFSKDFSFLRVDFYVINEQLYFSEFTFFSDAGFGRFKPESWDRKMGDWISLPDKTV